MLVVIVVTAATLLAAFVASYQKQLQAEQSFSHEQSLESIHILSLTTGVTAGNYSNFGFTLASKYVNPSIVLGISINNQPLREFNWTDLSTLAKGSYILGGDLNLTPFEEVQVTLDLNGPSSNFSFLAPNAVPVPNQFLKFDVFTQLENDFAQVYLPPTPLEIASEINPSGNNPITLLDGSTSFQPGPNSTIVSWEWNVSGGGLNSASTTITTPGGGDVAGPVAGTGTATFTVPSSFVWGGTDTISFTPGQPTTSDGTCALLGATVSPTSETVVSTTLTVDYTYSATASGAGCGASVTSQLSATGVVLTEVQLPISAAGEEYEISPALPALLPQQAPYLVTLTVTNSLGLQGTVAISFVPPP